MADMALNVQSQNHFNFYCAKILIIRKKIRKGLWQQWCSGPLEQNNISTELAREITVQDKVPEIRNIVYYVAALTPR